MGLRRDDSEEARSSFESPPFAPPHIPRPIELLGRTLNLFRPKAGGNQTSVIAGVKHTF